MKLDPDYLEAPCANSDDQDAWFVNKNGKLEPEDTREIRERWEADAHRQAEMSGDPGGLEMFLSASVEEADEEIAELEQVNRQRLRSAIRACYSDCPMATRLKCLAEGLEEPYGVRGGYPEHERRQIVKVRDEHNMTGARVVDIVISQDRRQALAEDGGGDTDGDQSSGRAQPQAPEVGPHDHRTKEEA